MALLAAPLSAPAAEPWLRAVAGSGLSFALLTSPDGSRSGLDRGLEDLVRAADLARTHWVARLTGPPDHLAYALDVIGVAPAVTGGAATIPLGRGVGRATAAAVDASAGGSHHHLLLVQVDETRSGDVLAALAAGDEAGALRDARVALARDAHRSWAVLGLGAGADEVLKRVVAPMPPTRLPAVEAAGTGLRSRVAPALAAALARAAVAPAARRLRLPPRLRAATASLLVAAVAAGGAGWVLVHHASTEADRPAARLVIPADTGNAPTPRVDTMAATWDRTAQVVLFGGAIPAGSGHGVPLDDTWRGPLPPDGPWVRIPPERQQPSPRLAGAMAADDTDGYVLLFGGEEAGDVGLGDTWSYGGSWVQFNPRDSPPSGPALAATEPSTGRVLLVTTCCALAAVPTGERMQTWRWTGGDWMLLGAAPGWVTTASLVADPWDGTVLMVADGGGHEAATFVWDGSAWSSFPGPVEPPYVPGTHPALSYDPGTHSVLDVVTGDDGTRQTWVFTSAHGWVRQAGGGGPPVVGLVLPEPIDGRAMLYGGQVPATAFAERWFWSQGVWTESLEPPPVASVPTAGFGAAAAADPQSGGAVLYGGNGADDQTWVWSGLSWAEEVFAAPIPAPRVGASMAYDPVARATLLVGGRLADGEDASDMWEWHGGVWSRLLVSGVPPPTVQAPMAWDWTRDQVVLLVPDKADALPSAQTWVWDGVAWSQRHPATSPPLRPESSMTWDPVTGTVLLAVPCCPGAVDQRTQTWTWDGADWSRRQTLHQPPIHAVVAEDDLHARVVLVAACCGGFDPVSTIGQPQTWTWDGQDWTRSPATVPALQDVAAVVTDAQGRPLLVARVAGAGPRHPLDGLWTWTGTAWRRLV
jgi:hypothetical protein